MSIKPAYSADVGMCELFGFLVFHFNNVFAAIEIFLFSFPE